MEPITIETKIEYADRTSEPLTLIERPHIIAAVFDGNVSAFYPTPLGEYARTSYTTGKGAHFTSGSMATTGPKETPDIWFDTSFSYLTRMDRLSQEFDDKQGDDLVKAVLAKFANGDAELVRGLGEIVDEHTSTIARPSRMDIQPASYVMFTRDASAARIRAMVFDH